MMPKRQGLAPLPSAARACEQAADPYGGCFSLGYGDADSQDKMTYGVTGTLAENLHLFERLTFLVA